MPLLLLHGDNDLAIDEAVGAERAPFETADVLTLDGPEVPLPALSEACMTAGLFDPQRLVIVRGLHERGRGARKTGAQLEEIKGILQSVPPTTTVLLVCKGMEADHQLARDVRDAGGEVRAYTTPRKQDLPRWVVGRGRRHHLRVDPAAAELLVELVGSNVVRLDTEMDKLAAYAGEEQRLTPSMVELLVGAVSQDSIFALVDAIAAGDRARALHLLHTQLESAPSTALEFALRLIPLLSRQVRILLRIRLGREAGRSTGQLTAELKLPRYYADRYFRQASRLSKERLAASFEKLAALEYALKSGAADAATGLDLVVTELCS
jgi:DNA polymerase-3 subunit delta